MSLNSKQHKTLENAKQIVRYTNTQHVNNLQKEQSLKLATGVKQCPL